MVSGEDEEWGAALARADALAVVGLGVPGPCEGERQSWDHCGVRGMLAVTLYAVALRDGQSVIDVPLSRMLVPLLDRGDFLSQANVLAGAGHDLEAIGSDPVVRQWYWLLRTWDPEAGPGRWEGMTRAIARGLPDPAIDVLHGWARAGVEVSLVAQRGGIARRTAVEITTGPYAGVVGRVECAVFDRAPGDRRDLASGPPARYGVNLGSAHGFRTEPIAAEHISVSEAHPL